MKKFLTIGALTLGLAAFSQQEASAWIKCNFSVGLNWSWEAGNNNYLWGLVRTGQVPGYPTDYGYSAHGSPSPYAGMMGGGMVAPPPVAYDGGHMPHGAPGFVAPPPQTVEPPAGKSAAPAQPTTASYYGTNGYQPVNYQVPSYYQAPNYSTPSYGYYGSQGYYGYGSYGNYQAPSYWYGN